MVWYVLTANALQHMALMGVFSSLAAHLLHTAQMPVEDTVLPLAVFMYCRVDRGEAIRIAKPRIERHFQSVSDAASEHAGRQLSADYKNYDKMVEKVRTETFES
jgi:hypothetical protein